MAEECLANPMSDTPPAPNPPQGRLSASSLVVIGQVGIGELQQ